jgi:hypothetical protein
VKRCASTETPGKISGETITFRSGGPLLRKVCDASRTTPRRNSGEDAAEKEERVVEPRALDKTSVNTAE